MNEKIINEHATSQRDTSVKMDSDAKAPDIRDQVSQRLGRRGAVSRLLDRFVTHVSGIAPSGVEPWFIWSRPTFHAAALVWLFGGAAGTVGILAFAPAWLLPLAIVTLIATSAGARAGMLTVMHDAIHMAAEHPDSRVRKLFLAIGHVMSTLLFVQDFDGYMKDHLEHHDESIFAGPNDPDVRFIRSLGFEPGMTKSDLWQQYRNLRWARSFHTTMFKARWTSQLRHGPLPRRAASAAFWIAILSMMAVMGWGMMFLIAWVLPVTVLFQRNALQQFLGKHRWMKRFDATDTTQASYAELTSARFALDAPPAQEAPLVERSMRWVYWSLRLVFIHAPYRAKILWGDLVHHDSHHYHGLQILHDRGVDLPRYAQPDVAWMNTAYGRRVYEAFKLPEDPEMTAFWNAHDPLEATFELWSQMEPNDFGTPPTREDLNHGTLGM